MKRVQNKCLIVSAAVHGLVLVALLVSSAFVPHRPPEETVTFTLLTIPAHLVDEPNMVSGGNPRAGLPDIEPELPTPVVRPAPAPARQEPPPVLPEPKPEPKPEPPVIRPDPKPERAKDPTPVPEKKAPPKPEPVEKPEPSFDFSKATRKTISAPPPRKSISRSTQEDSRAAAREQQLASAAGDAIARMQRGLSTGVGEIDVPGPGGAAYASYNLALRKFYENAWVTPSAYSDREPVVEVEVTIRGDGTVLSSRIIKRSNKNVLDQSVQTTLNRVKKVPPFPSGNNSETRTFRINFNLSSKLNIG